MTYHYATGHYLPKFQLKVALFRGIPFLLLINVCLCVRARSPEPSGAAPRNTVIDTTKTTVRDTLQLEEVVVSTGYQTIPKERATGSFVFVDSATFHRSVSPNVLERLDGVTSGLIINKGQAVGQGEPFLTIRGRSTLFGNADALIVVDGFPFEGDISQINAADVASVSILRDAAAASIWGTRSGNGVIVITTKKGVINQPLRVEAGAVYSTANRPDLHSREQMTATQYLELEKTLFDAGYYNTNIRNVFRPISEGVAVLAALRAATITQAQADAQLAAFAARDIRSEMEELFYRQQQQQQYRLQLSGGGQQQSYFLSGSYNRLADHLQGSGQQRGTVDAKQTLQLLKERLHLSTGLNYAFSTERRGGAGSSYTPYTPYDRLRDDHGGSLPVVNDFKWAYLETAGGGQLLDWYYRPLDERSPDINIQNRQVRLQTEARYRMLPSLNVIAAYQYLHEAVGRERLNGPDRYYTRNLINRYSYFEGTDLIRPIALGSISDQRNVQTAAHTYRFQVQYDKTLGGSHRVIALMGYEGSDQREQGTSYTLYGYDPDTRIHANANIDPARQYTYFYSSSASRINTAPALDERVSTGRSYYGNATYTFREQVDVSGSFRRDESNIFGVKSNQRGVPLWSTGIAWHLDKAAFYGLDWLPKLKLRATYGYNGNVDRSLSGYLTVRIWNVEPLWNSPYGEIFNPPNPALRWEKVQTWNAGVDFALPGNRVEGSVDVYRKNGTDLIGDSPIAPQTGVSTFRGNNSDTRTDGVDVALQSLNLDRAIRWQSHFLLSYGVEKVTKFSAQHGSNLDIVRNNRSNPLEGYPYFALFSYPYAGLSADGNPQGYLDGEPSTNYSGILYGTDPEALQYHGSSFPRFFGNLRNTFTYHGLELSFNLAFKLGYYFRQGRVFNGSEYGYTVSGYAERWQQPGDENRTSIPALAYPANSSRAALFTNSSSIVHRADHVRIQDIRLGYLLPTALTRGKPIRSAQCYAYATRFGTAWQRAGVGLDPDAPTAAFRQPLQFTLGLTINL